MGKMIDRFSLQRGSVLEGRAPRFGDQEAVSGDTECRVMVETAPAASFVIAQTKLLLELLIIALDRKGRLDAACCFVDER